METHFEAASNYLSTHDIKLSDDEKLKLYGLYKQTTIGDCNTAKPNLFQFVARAKWDAWNALKGMTKDEAAESYVQRVEELHVGWSRQGEYDVQDQASSEDDQKQGMGNAVSTLCYDDGQGTEEKREQGFFDYVYENDIDNVRKYITVHHEDVNQRDDQGLSALHHACDRGYTEMIDLLLELDADVNIKSDEGETPMHYACMSEQLEVAKKLMKYGCDTSIKDDAGSTAFEQADSSFLKELGI
ncbi:acyl--binding domain-containing protein 6 [Lichtheimia corymbifera JMRC:FSU:9682]|uniref:Acyl--binding domain-containing protein 6 n=1 Tax=Lichtheimia corymbifera JMRC:FSU:9682 TaxID=1263082 RepID=A0A068RWA7_9FUNG|nr:acyl--binding domain-containing protein 6 [Lichtheimia corymbifera JMRC:FSU:9682]